MVDPSLNLNVLSPNFNLYLHNVATNGKCLTPEVKKSVMQCLFWSAVINPRFVPQVNEQPTIAMLHKWGEED